MKQQLEHYPPDVRVLLQQAGELLEQLDRMERDFRAWEETQVVKRAQLPPPSFADAARLQWKPERGR